MWAIVSYLGPDEDASLWRVMLDPREHNCLFKKAD
jgi:hypothetical protein